MKSKAHSVGLAYWMNRVLRECAAASRDLAVDPVHDLRVALRRCRSMADGIMAVDPDPAWKEMKRAGKQLFASLGALRDLQVMQDWAEHLGSTQDMARANLLRFLAQREENARSDAARALGEFDRKQWKRWTLYLSARATRLQPGSVIYQHLALERWLEAFALHRKAMRARSPHALHSLRIGIKRLRYVVENFLPEHHERWKEGLKRAQDVLGEVHDLDVLWAALLQSGAFTVEEDQARWQHIITAEKERRTSAYIASATGPDSIWRAWRAELPRRKDAELAGLQRIRVWAAFRDSDLRHSRLIARLGLHLYDGLVHARVWSPSGERERKMLYIASILHHVEVPGAKQNSHKTAYRLVRKMRPLLGWRLREWRMIAAIVRYHSGGLPTRGQKIWDALQLSEKRIVRFLAAVLRLAESFDADHSSRIKSLQVQNSDGLIRIIGEGYLPSKASALPVSRARHLLEIACKRPVYVQPLRRRPLRRASQ